MKKLILGIMFINILLFGSGFQASGSKVQPTAPSSKDKTKPALPGPKGATTTFNKAQPPQLTLRIPVDLDEVPKGLKTVGGLTTGEQYLFCSLRRNTGHGDSWDYNQKIPLHSGKYTVIVKFNGIPTDKLAQINAYNCTVVYKTDGDDVSLRNMPLSFFEDFEDFYVGGPLKF